MEIVIEIKSQEALPLLKELEKLQWIKLKEPLHTESLPLSQKFAGKLSKETADALHKHTAESRSGWNRDF